MLWNGICASDGAAAHVYANKSKKKEKVDYCLKIFCYTEHKTHTYRYVIGGTTRKITQRNKIYWMRFKLYFLRRFSMMMMRQTLGYRPYMDKKTCGFVVRAALTIFNKNFLVHRSNNSICSPSKIKFEVLTKFSRFSSLYWHICVFSQPINGPDI